MLTLENELDDVVGVVWLNVVAVVDAKACEAEAAATGSLVGDLAGVGQPDRKKS